MLHKCSVHDGNSVVMRLMRIEFWNPKLKNLIKTVSHSSKACVLLKHIMGALPAERTTISRSFTHTGIDFAGPFDIKSYVGRECKTTKGYVLVLVYFSKKGIHLKLRFSRHSCPSTLHSDNGTASVGAANVLLADCTDFLYNPSRTAF